MKFYVSNCFNWTIINADSKEEAAMAAEIEVGMFAHVLREATEEEVADYAADAHACRVCGCTDEWGCPEGCYWVERDLCSQCAEE